MTATTETPRRPGRFATCIGFRGLAAGRDHERIAHLMHAAEAVHQHLANLAPAELALAAGVTLFDLANAWAQAAQNPCQF